MKKNQMWWIYFGTGMGLNLLAILLFRSHISLTVASSMPAAMALSIMAEGLFDRRPNKNKFMFLKYNGEAELLELDDSERPSYERRRENWIFDLKIGFGALPLFLPFVFFFADWAKIAFPIIAVVLAAAVFGSIALVSMRKAAKAEREMTERRLKEQQQKEESGKWK